MGEDQGSLLQSVQMAKGAWLLAVLIACAAAAVHGSEVAMLEDDVGAENAPTKIAEAQKAADARAVQARGELDDAVKSVLGKDSPDFFKVEAEAPSDADVEKAADEAVDKAASDDSEESEAGGDKAKPE